MGTTIVTFVITGAIAAVIMFVLMKIFPPVLSPWADLAAEAMGEHATMTEMIVNFFTAEDFVGLLSRQRHAAPDCLLHPLRFLPCRPDRRKGLTSWANGWPACPT